MLITFKSVAAGDVIMFGDVARQMMQIMGKEPGDEGIVTVEQLPAAIALLQTAMAADKAAARAAADRSEQDFTAEQEKESPQQGKSNTGGRSVVRLYQRAVPLLELLTWAQKKNKPVIWGG